MIKLLIFFLIIVEGYYITSFNIIIRKNMLGSVSNFLNLNEILTNNNYFNYMKIYKFNNSSICFNYKTYSNYEHYKYNNISLIKKHLYYLILYFKIHLYLLIKYISLIILVQNFKNQSIYFQ